MSTQTVDAQLYKKMIVAGAANLKNHAREINDLNVFPIPDGDTGDNMLLTVMGGADAFTKDHKDSNSDLSLGDTANLIANGMLFSARGNSGVILSQFFAGFAKGLEGFNTADVNTLKKAVTIGVDYAYDAVFTPVEGTILTVIKDADKHINSKNINSVEEFFNEFLNEANRSLKNTPELLPVLKKAGVVDSGGAGLIEIISGMKNALINENLFEENNPSYKTYNYKNENANISENKKETHENSNTEVSAKNQTLNFNAFDENSVLTYGYCTELLLRLQNSKTNVETFDVNTILNFLKTVGDSVVAFKSGSIVKIHVHTFTPHKVLAFCQQYGEFLTVKIENMSLQHNSINSKNENSDKNSSEDLNESKNIKEAKAESNTENNKETNILTSPDKKAEEKKDFGFIAVASGNGIKNMFETLGADYIVNGGQSMNPSAEDFLAAFKSVNAKNIFVLPNNGNIILTANQAAKIYKAEKENTEKEIYVLNSKTLGEGHAALTMIDTENKTPSEVYNELENAMRDVITAGVSTCSRDVKSDNFLLYKGEYIGFVNDDILSADSSRKTAAVNLLNAVDFTGKEILIVICGKESNQSETDEIVKSFKETHKMCEVYTVNGEQSIYDYLFIIE